MKTKLIAAVTAATIAMTSFSAAPARAFNLDSGETARLLLGAGAVFYLGHLAAKNKYRRSQNGPVYYNPTPNYRHNNNVIRVPAHCVHGHGHSRWIDRNCVKRHR
jgi:hypothetical protein